MFLTHEAMDEYADAWEDHYREQPDALDESTPDLVVFVTLIDNGELQVDLDTLF